MIAFVILVIQGAFFVPTEEAVVDLLAVALKLAFAFFVLSKNPRSAVNRLWALVLLSLVFGDRGEFVLRLIQNPRHANIANLVGHIGYFFTPAFFLHFSLALTSRRATLSRKWLYPLIYGPTILFCLAQSAGFITETRAVESGYTSAHAAGYSIFLLWSAVVSLIALWVCYEQWKNGTSEKERSRTLFVLLGVAIPLLLAILVDNVTPLMGVESFYVAVVGTTSLAAFVTYAVVRYEHVALTPESASSAIVDALRDLLAVTDPEGRIVFSNASFRASLGFNERTVTGTPISSIVSGAARVLESARSPESAGHHLMLMEGQYTTHAGRSFPVIFSVSAIKKGGEMQGFVFLANDVSEHQKLSRKYQESQTKYRSIVEGSLDGIVIIQRQRIFYANPSAVRIFGYGSAEEMSQLTLNDIVAPASRPFVAFESDGRQSGESIVRNFEVRGLTRTGKVIDLEMNATSMMWNDESAVQASFRDITERKMLERDQALWLWEQETMMKIDRQLVAMVDLAKTLHAITENATLLTRADFAGVLMYDEENSLYAWRAMKGNQKPLPSDSYQVLGIHREFLGAREPVVVQDFGRNPSYPTESFPILTSEQIVSIVTFPLVVNQRTEGMLVVGFRKYHIFSDRELRLLGSLAEKSSIAVSNAELYENLIKREQELELLTGARVTAQEEERRRIAREIHDGLGQILTAVKFNLEILEDTFAGGADERKRLVEVKNLLDNAMKEAREISYNLMPSVLDDFGLAPALQLFCEQFSKRRNCDVQFHAHGLSKRLDPSIEIGLYRIAQEALNNVAKHAGATETTVQIIMQEERIRMTVEDNGKGIALRSQVARNPGREGMGLVSMRERASSFNGTLTIDSAPGKGTVVTVEIPLTKSEKVQKEWKRSES
ncbi:MAG: PAS domain S-box protein [Bacteroidota bacterium]